MDGEVSFFEIFILVGSGGGEGGGGLGGQVGGVRVDVNEELKFLRK